MGAKSCVSDRIIANTWPDMIYSPTMRADKILPNNVGFRTGLIFIKKIQHTIKAMDSIIFNPSNTSLSFYLRYYEYSVPPP